MNNWFCFKDKKFYPGAYAAQGNCFFVDDRGSGGTIPDHRECGYDFLLRVYTNQHRQGVYVINTKYFFNIPPKNVYIEQTLGKK